MFVMLLISVITQIPQLNLSKLFSLERDTSSDPERQLLADNATNSASYMRQIDDEEPSLANSHSLDQSDQHLAGNSKY